MTSPAMEEATKPTLANLAADSIRFFVWGAGEGLSPLYAPEPEDTLFRFACATGDEDYDGYADKFLAEHASLTALLGEAEKALEAARSSIVSGFDTVSAIAKIDATLSPLREAGK